MYTLSSSRKPSGHFFLWFPPSTSSYVFFMASLVGFLYGFRRGRKTCCYGFRRRIFDGFCCRRGIQHFRTISSESSFFGFLGVVSVAGLFMVSVVAGKCFCYGFHRRFVHGFRRGKERFLMVSVVVFLRFPAATGPRLSLRWKPYKTIRTFP